MIPLTRPARPLLAVAAFLLTSCSIEEKDMATQITGSAQAALVQAGTPSDSSLRQLASRRIYFAHQSVGGNVVAGLETLLAERPELGLRIVQTREPGVLAAGPAFVHFYAGRNEAPATKNADFVRMLDARPQPDDAIALLKYCYVDVNDSTDVAKLFADYQHTVDAVRRRHPDVTLVHVTMPLMSAPRGKRAILKRLLGRGDGSRANAKRNAYNALLRQAYASKEPIFDIAELESTHADGSRSVVAAGGDTTYVLARELTWDGGHLNDRGQRLAAERLLAVLAAVPARDR